MSKTVLTFIADTHYYSKTLGTEGKAYELRSDSDQKCLAETGEIIDAAFSKLSKSDCDAVLIAGDLTNDGERVCHEEFREKLRKLKETKNVYVVTATHDWCCDCNPRRFEGDRVYNDVPTLHHNELYDFYREFGTDNAFAEYRTTLGTASYAVDIGDDVTLIALIDDKNGRDSAGFKKEHLEWIKEQIKGAKQRGRLPVAMEHHLLYPHISPLITKGARCRDGEHILNEMADAGLKFVFVGHSHIQRIDEYTSPAGNKIYEVNIGSLVGYPAPMVTMTVENGDITVNTERLKTFVHNGEEKNLTEYLARHATKIVSVVFDAAESGDRGLFAGRLEALGIKSEPVMKYYFIIAPVLKKISGATVGSAGKLINAITFGKAIPRESVKALESVKVTQVIDRMMLNVLDGAVNKYSPKDDFYKVVRGAVSAPLRISRKLHLGGKATEFLSELDRVADEALSGGAIDNNYLHIKNEV